MREEIRTSGSENDFIGNDTMAGQIATFMSKEGLGLSWKEAVEILPYELILLMAKDKLHYAGDDTKVEVDDSVFFKKE